MNKYHAGWKGNYRRSNCLVTNSSSEAKTIDAQISYSPFSSTSKLILTNILSLSDSHSTSSSDSHSTSSSDSHSTSSSDSHSTSSSDSHSLSDSLINSSTPHLPGNVKNILNYVYTAKTIHAASNNLIELSIKNLLPCEKKFNTVRKISHFLNDSGTQTMQKFKCCINYCVLFKILHQETQFCTICNLENSANNFSYYFYFPLIDRIRAMFASPFFCKQLQYRSSMLDGSDDSTNIRDWFDGSNYKKLRRKGLFESSLDIGFSYSTDGLELKSNSNRNKVKRSCWPELITILSLPPELRTKLDNIHCLSIIPTTKAGEKQDFESFHQPKIMEFKKLSDGISIFNCLLNR
jgi:hypothetical protein